MAREPFSSNPDVSGSSDVSGYNTTDARSPALRCGHDRRSGERGWRPVVAPDGGDDVGERREGDVDAYRAHCSSVSIPSAPA